MTDSYHFQIEPEPRAELNCGEFVLTADGGLHRRTHWDHLVTLSAADVSWYGWRDAEALARHLESQEYKRRDSIVFPSGASILTSGDKIVGRVEARLVTAGGASYVPSMGGSVTVYCVGGGGGGGGSGSPVQRAPLPNSDEWRGIGHKAHDTFGADFIVTKGEAPTAPLHTSPTTDSAYPAIAGLLRG